MKDTTDYDISPENLHKNHRQRVRNKFINNGLKGFAEHEILEFLLFYAVPLRDTNPTAHRLINKYGSLSGVLGASYESLIATKGVGEQSATLIKLIPAIMQECNKLGLAKTVIDNQKEAMEYIAGMFKGSSNELFYVICLNAQNQVLDVKEMSSGSPSRVDIKIRNITNYCLQQNCDRIIIAHNHPQSDPNPSNDDINMTQKLFNSSVLNDIDILDHIIVSPASCYSFAETGVMNQIKQEVLTLMKYNLDPSKIAKFSSSTANYVILPSKK